MTLSVHGPSPARSLALDECLALGARTFLPVRGDRPTRLRSNSSPSFADSKPAAEGAPGYLPRGGRCILSAAMSFAPGSSEEKRQLDEYILEPRWIRLGLDTALAQKLAGIMLARFRELAESFPPDPRPKR